MPWMFPKLKDQISPELSHQEKTEVVVVAWAVRYGDLSHEAIVEAGLTGMDVTSHATRHQSLDDRTFPASERRKVAAAAVDAAAVLDLAWSRAGLSPERNRLDGRGERIRHTDTALVAGSSLGLLDEGCRFAEDLGGSRNPYALSRSRGNALTAPLAIRFGLGAGTHTVSAASATGGNALVAAGHLLRCGQADRVAVVCTDRFAHPTVRQALHAVGATSDINHSLPLSAERSGMRPVAISVAMILETAVSSATRGQEGLACWLGGALKNECYHLIVPEPTGDALSEASGKALEQANLAPEAIDWLSLHATGTQTWDPLEIQCARRIFGPTLPHLSAFKRSFGHGMGAAGLLEAGLLCEGLANAKVPPWPEPTDPAMKLSPPSAPLRRPHHAMMWSAGMGGDNSVNIFSALG